VKLLLLRRRQTIQKFITKHKPCRFYLHQIAFKLQQLKRFISLNYTLLLYVFS